VDVSGAIDVLLAAGFVAATDEETGEKVLLHEQNAVGTDKARYVRSRLQDLL
jgi:hypothetical protein